MTPPPEKTLPNASPNGNALGGEAKQLEARLRAELADIQARYSEHHNPATVKLALQKVRREDPLAEATERERVLRTARLTVDREDAEANLRLPPERDDYTLAAYLREPKTPKIERVENLQRASHKTLLVASYKTGKTTLHANLTRSLTEGSQFLGRFAVKRPEGRVGVWNAEMESDDYQSYLATAGVSKADRVAIWNLRGYRLPLLSDAGAEAAQAWLRNSEVAYWIIDPWARVCSWSGVDENVNAEVGPLLQRVDEIANDAGVAEVLIVHHAGHVRGRPRGATILPDWADGIWLYTRDEDSDKRYLRAEGRGVALPEGLVEIDDSGRTVYKEVSRKAQKVKGLVDEFVAHVAGNPGCLKGEALEAIEGGHAVKAAAAKRAIDTGLVREEKDPGDGRKRRLYPGDAGGLL